MRVPQALCLARARTAIAIQRWRSLPAAQCGRELAFFHVVRGVLQAVNAVLAGHLGRLTQRAPGDCRRSPTPARPPAASTPTPC